MQLFTPMLVLFALNFLDAILTIYWVRNGFASESNQLMAGLLDIGDAPFLIVKIAVGTIAAVVFWRWRNLQVAKYGLFFTLAVYTTLMIVHFFTGLSAFGILSDTLVNDFTTWSHNFFAVIY